ncbi:MAG: hypothetical protein ACPGVU_00730 [Limisphaerales bacterium]
MEGYLKCNCHHCEGPIEYPVESAGEVCRCPHCNLPTPLVVPGGEEDPNTITVGGGSAKIIVIGLVILAAVVIGVAGTVWYVGNLKKKKDGPPAGPKSEAPTQTVVASTGSGAVVDGPWKTVRPVVAQFQAGLSAAQVKEGRYVLSGPCTDCHKMYDPVTFERDAWNSTLSNMRGRAKLRGREYEDLQLFVRSIRN